MPTGRDLPAVRRPVRSARGAVRPVRSAVRPAAPRVALAPPAQRSRTRTRLLPWLVIATSAMVLAWVVWTLGRARPPAPPMPAPAPAARSVAEPGPASYDAAQWLAGRAVDWRVGWVRQHPNVLVIEFPGLAEQGASLNRTAALHEKAGAPRDRVLNDVELAQLIARSGDSAQTFYQGHDYTADQLARFFNLAARQGQTLTAQERRLFAVLARAGMVEGQAPDVRPAPGKALVTFTAMQPDAPDTSADETIDERRRRAVFDHELSHGAFATDASYRQHCRRFWHEELDASQRERFRQFLRGLGYDRGDETLMINEMQAFLAHTPDERAFGARSVGLTEAELERLRQRFRQGAPGGMPGHR